MRGREWFPAAAFPLVTPTTNTRITRNPCDTILYAADVPFHGEVGMDPETTAGSPGAFMRPLDDPADLDISL